MMTKAPQAASFLQAMKGQKGNKLVEKMMKKEEEDHLRMMLHDLFEEMVMAICSGEMDLKEAVDDFSSAAKSIDMKNLSMDDSEEED